MKYLNFKIIWHMFGVKSRHRSLLSVLQKALQPNVPENKATTWSQLTLKSNPFEYKCLLISEMWQFSLLKWELRTVLWRQLSVYRVLIAAEITIAAHIVLCKTTRNTKRPIAWDSRDSHQAAVCRYVTCIWLHITNLSTLTDFEIQPQKTPWHYDVCCDAA